MSDTLRLTALTFSYDGPGRQPCPKCGASMWWYDLKPFDSPRWLECEECNLLCDCETDQVFKRKEAIQ